MADLDALRDDMLGLVHRRGGGKDAAVAAALREVPRHLFLPDRPLEAVYRDEAVVIKRDGDGLPLSSSSQPAVMAVMLDQLGLEPGHRVLEIGAGTGYNAALIAHVVGPGGRVVTIDIEDDVVERARASLARAGYPGARVVCADGAGGFAAGAPYDRVIATVGVSELAPAWLAQLAPAGRIVVPLDLRGVQRSVAFERRDGHWTSRSIRPCGFLRLRGALAGTERTLVLDRDSALWLVLPDERPVDPDAVRAALDAGGTARVDVGVQGSGAELFDGLGLWLAAGTARSCTLSEPADAAVRRLPATPLRIGDRDHARGVADADGLALLARAPGASWMWPSPLTAVGYGTSGPELAADLAGRVRAWAAAGRPSTRGLRIDAHPAGAAVPRPAGGLVIDRPHTRLVLSWPGAA